MEIPKPLLKAIEAAFPWFLLGLVLALVAGRGEFRKVLAGLIAVAVPFVVIGALIPTPPSSWISYLAYPFGSVVLVIVPIILWHRHKTRLAERK